MTPDATDTRPPRVPMTRPPGGGWDVRTTRTGGVMPTLRMRHNLPLVITMLIAFLGTPPSAWPSQKEGASSDHHALARFGRSVGEYAELHRLLEMPLPPHAVTADAEQIARATAALAGAIRAARPGATRGDIFATDIAVLVRSRIAEVLERNAYDATVLLAGMRADSEPGASRPAVNGAFPWDAGSAMWAFVLRELPPLPEELEYRFVGRDLVLLDVDANLVADILTNALPAW